MILYVDDRQVTRRVSRCPYGPTMGPRRGGIWVELWPAENGYAYAELEDGRVDSL